MKTNKTTKHTPTLAERGAAVDEAREAVANAQARYNAADEEYGAAKRALDDAEARETVLVQELEQSVKS